MMAAHSAQARRLAKHRAELERALADHCSLDEARERLSRERWRDMDARLAARRCGTAIPAGETPAGRFWWERD